MVKARTCRIWWPAHLLASDPASGLLLFGWCLFCGSSVDLVVATAARPGLPQSDDLQEILRSTNGKMPIRLQEMSEFTMIGCCVADPLGDSGTRRNKYRDFPSRSISEQSRSLGGAPNFTSKENNCYSANGQTWHDDPYTQGSSDESCRRCNCHFSLLEDSIEPYRKTFIKSGNWMQLQIESKKIFGEDAKPIPGLHHLHTHGHMAVVTDAHVILYDCPAYGKNHLSLSSWGLPLLVTPPMKKPKWINGLQKKPLLLDLDSVVLALNCANAGRVHMAQHAGSSTQAISLFCRYILFGLKAMLWHFIAVCGASLSTVLYISIQLFHKYLNCRLEGFFVIVQKVFPHSLKNVHIRACQILYWPIFLQGTGFSSQSNVEYAHKAALWKHFVWSNVVMDVILGIIVGVALLTNVEAVCFWIHTVVRYMIDNVLRSGCVWLMGVPAGFKLNTELSELLGMISLNAVQIFSTLWFSTETCLGHIIEVIALFGIIFGLTVPAALCIDMLRLATLHVTTLHWLILFLYSQQIQALASLWRLFRGRKWNPLRQRLDSYDYTVEQHVVGSLLFTPVLLLLPTTSVFYIFFTMLSTTVTFICMAIEITISTLHATPIAEIVLWFMKGRIFPSGIWFQITTVPALLTHANYGRSDEALKASRLDEKEGPLTNGESEALVFLLRSNYATIGQVISPHYKNIFTGVATSFGKSLAYGILSGQRIPSALHTNLPPLLPWMHICPWEYWKLCHSAILSCRL